MKQTKHTAGPWVVKNCDDVAEMIDVEGFGIYAVSDLDQSLAAEECPSAICFMNENWGEFQANAHLIAAAPDMLAALRECRSPISGYAVKDAAQALEVLSHFLDHIRKVDAIASAAIAKAEGR